MGFYIRKSVSAGPFRFNLSSSGLGMSLGVRGLRLGTGPRGNYVHMGRGGLYYRASLGNRPPRQRVTPQPSQGSDTTPMQTVENGDVLEMASSSSAGILEQINEKAASLRSWPWVLGLALAISAWTNGEPDLAPLSGPALFVGLAAAGMAWYWDKQRRTVVIVYDLADHFLRSYEHFAKALEELGTADRIWNIESAGHTNDWKRNAGAGTLLNRKSARIGYGLPSIVKTNVSVPAIIGGKQNIYFFPDVAIVSDGNKFGAIAHHDIHLLWSDSYFLETESVPRDARVEGYSWQYVNKNGSPDRRFNNNRQIPRCCYQQMGLQSSGIFRKILQISKNCDRSGLNAAYARLGDDVDKLSQPQNSQGKPALLAEPSLVSTNSFDERAPVVLPGRQTWEIPAAAVAVLVLLYGLWSLGTQNSAPPTNDTSVESSTSAIETVAAATVSPSFDCGVVQSAVLKMVCATPALAQADQALAAAYAQARQAAADPEALKLEQRAWIRLRNNSKADVGEIQQMYSDRISELTAMAGIPPQPAAAPAEQPGDQAITSTEPSYVAREYHYIVGLDANGDNWLALRSEPSGVTGIRLRQLGPDILMTVLGTDGAWSHVKTMAGDEGWVSSSYIRCCKRL